MKAFILDLPEVIEAVNVLFGRADAPALPTHALLTPLSVKAAYRRRAFETHPDRAVHTGEQAEVLVDRFRELSEAYETVMRYVCSGGAVTWGLAGAPRAGMGKRHGNKCARTFTGIDAGLSPAVLYAGEVPCRRLLLGQYLYYSRAISRSTLGAALVWQKMGRPLIGQIAVKWKWLAREDIQEILSTRMQREKFCDAAERLGYLAPSQTLILLGRQRVIQPRLGQYFIEKGILDADALARAVRELRRRNRKYDR